MQASELFLQIFDLFFRHILLMLGMSKLFGNSTKISKDTFQRLPQSFDMSADFAERGNLVRSHLAVFGVSLSALTLVGTFHAALVLAFRTFHATLLGTAGTILRIRLLRIVPAAASSPVAHARAASTRTQASIRRRGSSSFRRAYWGFLKVTMPLISCPLLRFGV